MESFDIIFTIGYGLISMCFVAPPTEFIAAGVTVQNLFSSLLGSEDLNFIYYHIRRTTITLLVHAFLPLGYYMSIGFFSPHLELFSMSEVGYFWCLYLAVCLTLPTAAIILAVFWSKQKWSNHPIAKILAHHAPQGNTWRSVASSINVEFRRIDKFTTGTPGRRLIVTDSWIMKTTAYFVHLAFQSDVHLTVVGTDQHHLSHESTMGVQYLNITVHSVNDKVEPFKIRLNAMEYGDLREKIQRPIRTARDVVIHQSLSDRFLEAFEQQVSQNACYRKPVEMELEPCIGCMQKPANIKLKKLCDNTNEGSCVPCYCRPMWCLECMGKWYASRQDQQEPETWLSSHCPCPTCRAVFCMLDVCIVV